MNTSTTKNRTDDWAANAGQAADQAKNKAKEVAATGMDKAKEMVSSATDKAKDVASTIGEKAEDATSAVGSGMKSLAGTIRDKAPQQGVLGSASSAVADTLESGGRYLQEEGLSGMGEDLTNLIRRNPLPAVLIGIGIGFLLARATRT